MANPAEIADAIASVRQHFVDHPEDARGPDTEARARLVDGLRVHVEGPNGWTADTDMARALGGEASAPSPGWLMRAAVASCDAVLVAMQAAEEGVTLDRLEAHVTSESDDRGLVGGADVPAGPERVSLTVSLSAAGRSQDELEALVRRALKRSPVSEALSRSVPIAVTVEAAW